MNLFGISSSIVTILNVKLHNKSTKAIVNTNYDNIKTSSVLTDVVSLRGIGGRETLNQNETSVGNQDKGSLVTLPITYENISLEHAKTV